MAVAGAAIGGVATNVVSRFVPVGNPNIKDGIAAGFGAILSGQKGMLSDAGKGMIGAAASRIVGRTVPALAGDDDMGYVAEVVEGIDEAVINGTADGNGIINGIDAFDVSTTEDFYRG